MASIFDGLDVRHLHKTHGHRDFRMTTLSLPERASVYWFLYRLHQEGFYVSIQPSDVQRADRGPGLSLHHCEPSHALVISTPPTLPIEQERRFLADIHDRDLLAYLTEKQCIPTFDVVQAELDQIEDHFDVVLRDPPRRHARYSERWRYGIALNLTESDRWNAYFKTMLGQAAHLGLEYDVDPDTGAHSIIDSDGTVHFTGGDLDALQYVEQRWEAATGKLGYDPERFPQN